MALPPIPDSTIAPIREVKTSSDTAPAQPSGGAPATTPPATDSARARIRQATGLDGSNAFTDASVSATGGAEQSAKAPAPMHDITLQHASVLPDKSLVDNGVRYPPVISGNPSAPQIVTFDGKRALQYSVPEGTGSKERIENKLSPASDPNALTFGTKRYAGFDFQVPKDAAAFKSSALFFQEWQGYPHGPPVSLKVNRSQGSPFTISLCVRNMDTGPDSAQPDKVVWTGKLPAGEWHRFVVMTSPDFAQPNGEVKLWIDGTRMVDWKGKIGYDPSVVQGAQNNFDTKFGLYQPEPNNAHSVYFSDVRYSDQYAAASP
jgi:hypothetical protein